MLPTFVIGLREGLEAALIIGIVAAFLRQRGRSDTLRWMWLGVAGAVALCAGVAFGLHLAEENLPQRQQEQLETLIALAAVGMISWMIVWMRRHSADLRGDLHQRAEVALVEGSVFGLVAMAFLAVLREGLRLRSSCSRRSSSRTVPASPAPARCSAWGRRCCSAP